MSRFVLSAEDELRGPFISQWCIYQQLQVCMKSVFLPPCGLLRRITSGSDRVGPYDSVSMGRVQSGCLGMGVLKVS